MIHASLVLLALLNVCQCSSTLVLILNDYLAQHSPTINSLWDQSMSTASTANATKMNWETITGGQVVILLPFTTNAELNADDGVLEIGKHPSHPTTGSLTQLALEDHVPLSILPQNIDQFYSLTNQFAATKSISVVYKSIPKGLAYSDYIRQILQACNGKQSGAFDVIWLDASAAGILGDCLSNLYDWSSDIAVNQDPHILANNIYKSKLVGLPIESSTGMLYFNKNVFVRNMIEQGFTTMAEFEALVQQIVVSERTIHNNFDVIGLSMSLRADETFMGSFIELLAHTNYSSIFNTYANDSTIATPQTINLIQRLVAWIDAGIIEPTQIDEQGVELPFAQKFLQGRSVFMRSYSTADLSKVEFEVGYAPMQLALSTDNHAVPMSVNNGWSLGVYRYSSNLDASVNIVKRIASSDFQRQSILASSHPIQPTYPNPLVCAKYGEKCAILKATTVINRPAVIAGPFYTQLSQLLTKNITSLITNPTDIISSLINLDKKVDTLLGLKIVAFTGVLDLGAGIGTVIKKIPSGMGTQFTILMVFMFGCIIGIYLYKRRTLGEKREALLDTESAKAGPSTIRVEQNGFKKVAQFESDELDKIEI